MTADLPRIWWDPEVPGWLLVDCGGGRVQPWRPSDRHRPRELPDGAVRLVPARVAVSGPRLPLGPGEDDVEVWIPPRQDCVEYRPDLPCPHCDGLYYHHRTRRCSACGRRR